MPKLLLPAIPQAKPCDGDGCNIDDQETCHNEDDNANRERKAASTGAVTVQNGSKVSDNLSKSCIWRSLRNRSGDGAGCISDRPRSLATAEVGEAATGTIEALARSFENVFVAQAKARSQLARAALLTPACDGATGTDACIDKVSNLNKGSTKLDIT